MYDESTKFEKPPAEPTDYKKEMTATTLCDFERASKERKLDDDFQKRKGRLKMTLDLSNY